MSALLEWGLFLGLAGVSIAMAALMLLTMSMFRAGLALMSSFLALGGLFILLDADLMALIQVMMNVGGMLVMILFMVMMMMDPGGEMMWGMKRDMKLRGPGALSMRMPRGPPPAAESARIGDAQAAAREWTCSMHPEIRRAQPGQCPICGMDLVPVVDAAAAVPAQGEQGAHGEPPANGNAARHYRMMVDMAMSTAQLPWALAVGAASGLLLALLLARTAWTLASSPPAMDSTVAVGELLLSRYMLAFEGAAFLILAGMAGAVILAKREAAAPPVPVEGAKEQEHHSHDRGHSHGEDHWP